MRALGQPTVWTPPQAIRVKVLGLVWRGADLLLGSVTGSDGRVIGMRPLGGSVLFGETREQALAREFDEELGCRIAVTGPWHVLENIFGHEGATGHEIVFVADTVLADFSLYDKDRVRYAESDGTACLATWHEPDRLPDRVELFPNGLSGLLASRTPRTMHVTDQPRPSM